MSSFAIAAVAALAGSAAVSRAALLTYDVRAVSGSAGVVVTDSKNVTVTAANQVVHFEVYGVLANGNGSTSDDGILAAGGSILSGNGGLLGALGNAAVPSAFQGVGYSVGTAADLDGDTDVDVGSNSTSSSTAYFIDRSPNTNPVAGASLLLGTFDFTVGGASGSTTVNFRPAVLTSGLAGTRNYHNFTIDGVSTATNGSDSSLVAAGPAVAVGYAVATPEPATLAAVVGLGLVGLRRRRAAR